MPRMNSSASPHAIWRATLSAGLLAGACDILSVILFYRVRGVSAERILHSVAAGALGREAARDGGIATAALGLGLHFVIAFAFAGFFCVVASRRPRLLKAPLLIGPVYGALVWLVMQRVVLPLSAVPPPSFPPPDWVPAFIAHLLFVGPPIVFRARRWLRPTNDAAPST